MKNLRNMQCCNKKFNMMIIYRGFSVFIPKWMTKESEIFIRSQSTQLKYRWGNVKDLDGDGKWKFYLQWSFLRCNIKQRTIKHTAVIRETMSALCLSVLRSDVLSPEEIYVWWQQPVLMMSYWSNFWNLKITMGT